MGLEKHYPFKNNEEWVDFMVKPSGISFAIELRINNGTFKLFLL
jgi:hypothetical protein